jgi:hypothetical protein
VDIGEGVPRPAGRVFVVALAVVTVTQRCTSAAGCPASVPLLAILVAVALAVVLIRLVLPDITPDGQDAARYR